MYKVITPVATEPVSLQEARMHLRLIADMSDASPLPQDALVSSFIVAGRQYAEHYTGRALAPQTLEMALHCFPLACEAIELDKPPVASVTSIKYTDPNGADQTLSESAYALSRYGDSRQVALTYGNRWPTAQRTPDAIRILYVTGSASADHMEAVKTAILMHVQLQYDALTPTQRTALEDARDSLLNVAKIWGR